MDRKALGVVVAGVCAWGMLVVGARAQSERLIDRPLAGEIMMQQLVTKAGDLLTGNEELKAAYVGRLLDQELVQEANRRGLTDRFDVQDSLRRARWTILINALKDDVIRSLPIPKEAEIKQAYEKEKSRWKLPEAFRVDVYTVPASNVVAVGQLNLMAATKKIDEAVIKSTNARQVASAVSGNWVSKENVPPVVWEALPGMAVGDLRVFKLDEEAVLVKKVEYRKERELSFEEAREAVKMSILSVKADAAWEAYLKKKLADLGIQ